MLLHDDPEALAGTSAADERVKPDYLQPGTQIGSYRVVDHLSSDGALAVVYKVSRDSQMFALKIARSLDPDKRTREHAEREVASLLLLRHQNIVRVHSYDRWPDMDGYPYVVMDLVDGVPLYEWQRRRHPSLRRIVDVFISVADALREMHSHDIFHRDLKSDNILIRATDGQPILIDFNVARPRSAFTLTAAGALVGTPAYWPPEAAAWWGTPSEASPRYWVGVPQELHTVGLLLYEMLSGTPALLRSSSGDDEENIFTVIQKIQTARPPPLHEVVPVIPLPLSQLVMRLLEREPAARFPDAASLRAALEGIRDTLPDIPFPCPLPAAPTSARSSSGTGSRSPPRQARSARKALGWGLGIGAALAFGVAVGAWAWTRFGPGPAPDSTGRVGAARPPEVRELPSAAGKEALGTAGSQARGEGSADAVPAQRPAPSTTPEPTPAVEAIPVVPAPRKAGAAATRAPAPKNPHGLFRESAPVVPIAPHASRGDEHRKPRAKSMGVPRGSRMRVRLLGDPKPGSSVEATLSRPFLVDVRPVLPSRTRLSGVASTRADGRVGIEFSRAVLPDGSEVALSATVQSLADGRPGLLIDGSTTDAGIECDAIVAAEF